MRSRRIARRLLLAAILVYAATVMLMFLSQADLVFPRHAVGPAGPLAPRAERLRLPIADGNVLDGVHIPPQVGPDGRRLLVLGFAGNAGNAQTAAEMLHEIYPEAHIVAFHYRGYAPSTGAPSAKALLADAPLVHDFAVERVRPTRTVAVGMSVGSGIAASLARDRKLDGLILVTPFDSLKAVAKSHYPWLPVATFFRHEIDSAAALKDVPVPVAIIAAERDQLVAPVRTDALRRAVPRLVFDRTISRAGHNDIYSHPEFALAMKEAFDRLKA